MRQMLTESPSLGGCELHLCYERSTGHVLSHFWRHRQHLFPQIPSNRGESTVSDVCWYLIPNLNSTLLLYHFTIRGDLSCSEQSGVVQVLTGRDIQHTASAFCSVRPAIVPSGTRVTPFTTLKVPVWQSAFGKVVLRPSMLAQVALAG